MTIERQKMMMLRSSFSRSPEKTKQKRGATPKAPFKGGCKRESRTTDDFDFVEVASAQQTSSELGLYSLNCDFRAFLVSRDTRYSLLHPCCRRPLERDSQVLG